MQVPSLVTTTFVGYVESKASLALWQLDIIFRTTDNIVIVICVPVVHEDVGLPEVVGRHPDVLHVVVLRRVPPHVRVSPLLRHSCS